MQNIFPYFGTRKCVPLILPVFIYQNSVLMLSGILVWKVSSVQETINQTLKNQINESKDP